jgi:hypothetical protein
MTRVPAVFALVLTVFAAGVLAGPQSQPVAPQQPPAAPAARRAVSEGDQPIAPPKEFQDLMKSNTAINPDGNGGSLNQNLTEGAENYAGVVKDAATLKANFARLRTMLTDMKIPEALQFVDAGDEAINNIARFAADAVWQQAGDEHVMASNRRDIERAQIALTDVCRTCHLKHRVYVIATPIRFEIAK